MNPEGPEPRSGRTRSRTRFRVPLVLLGLVALFGFVPTLRILPLGVVLLFCSEPCPLPVPVAGVLARNIRDTFGARRDVNRKHEGVDIFAPRGQAVLSSTEGVVIEVGVNSLGGRSVWVLGPQGHRHYYAHLESYGDVKKGQWVPVSQKLGTVGDSGNAKGTPTHLHYGIYRLQGGAINPFPLFRAWKE